MARILILLWLVLAGPAHAGWRVASSTHFRLFSQASPEVMVAQLGLLEDHRALLARVTGVTPDPEAQPLDIYLLENLPDATPGLRIPAGVLGYYQASAGGLAVFASVPLASPLGARSVLLHEVAHHFMLADSGHSYPLWYIEGFADYFATTKFQPGRIEFGHVDPGRFAWLMRDGWLPLETVLAGRLDLSDRQQAARFYAQSWLLTHFILRAEGGPDRLRDYLSRTARGEDPVRAFRLAIDPSPETMNARLAAYARDTRRLTYTRVARKPPQLPAVNVQELPASADRVLLPMIAIRQGIDATTGARLLGGLRAAAAAAPQDPLAREAQAMGELVHGDPAVARDLMSGATTPEALRLLGYAERTLGNRAAARVALEAAVARSPGDWRSLVALATLDGLPANDRQLDQLIRGWQLAPQVPENGLMLAHALGARGRLAEAAHVLMPLATSRHGAAPRLAAGQLLALARAGDRETFLAVFEGRVPIQLR